MSNHVYVIDMRLEESVNGKIKQREAQYTAKSLKNYLTTTCDNVRARGQKIIWIEVDKVLIWEKENLFLPWESPALNTLKKGGDDKPDKPKSNPLC